MKRSASLLCVLWVASASCSGQTLVVALYDYATLTARDAVRLTQTADRAFSHSGIHILWRHCHGALASTSGRTCGSETQLNEIVVNLRSHEAHTSKGERVACMGNTIITAAGGYYVNVFVPAVREQAAGFGLALDLLMGYAVAHEVGHCLLGPGHSYIGLMRGIWSRKDAQEISQLGLHLTQQEGRKAVSRIAWLNRNRPVRREDRLIVR